MAPRKMATVGSPLSHGGQIISGDNKMKSNGKAIATVGSKAVCSKHGSVTVVSGSNKSKTQGKAISMVGDKCSCGAQILAIPAIKAATD